MNTINIKPVATNPLRLASIFANISRLFSNVIANVEPSILCNAFRVRRPGPLPQSSYIFDIN